MAADEAVKATNTEVVKVKCQEIQRAGQDMAL